MKKLRFALTGIFFAAFLFSSYGQVKKVSYHTIKTQITANPEITLSVATYDQRIEVVDGSRNEEVVGYERSMMGIAYPVGTASGENFSDDFSGVIKNSLIESSKQVQIIKTNYTDSKQKILDNLIGSKSDRLMIITIKVWRTDTKTSTKKVERGTPRGEIEIFVTELIWDISLDIFNTYGDLLATNHTDGFESNPHKYKDSKVIYEKRQEIVNVKFKEVIDLLFSSPEIQQCMNQ